MNHSDKQLNHTEREVELTRRKIKRTSIVGGIGIIGCLWIFSNMKTPVLGKEEGKYSEVYQRIDEKVEVDWKLVLVNPWNELPEDYEVNTVNLKNGQAVDERILEDLQQMMDDCRAEGLSPLICSSYRDMDKQVQLFNRQVSQYLSEGHSEGEAIRKAGEWVAVPGTSEHQLGLAVDIVAEHHQVLDKTQEETDVQQWLMRNSYKYGFVLRYPEGKESITGINYEPWHYRYVGKEAALEMTRGEMTLEEYTQVM